MPPARRSEQTKDTGVNHDTDEEVKPKQFTPKQPDTWIFLLNDEILQHDENVENNPAIYSLKHPKSEKKALFLFTKEDEDIYEIKQFKEDYRSWFIGNNVQCDGSLYITSRMDPVFLVLPYLMAAEKSGKYMTLDQIIVDEEYSDCYRLHNTSTTALAYVTDYKGGDDFKAYKYSLDKTLAWLKSKTEQVITALKKSDISLSGACSAELIKSSKDKQNEDEYLKYAFGIVSDYLPVDLSTRLQEYLGIPTVAEKRPTDSPNPPAKRAKIEEIAPLEDYSNTVTLESKPKGKQSTAQKQLNKVDKKGMKSMMSFFSPKSK